MRVSEIAKRLKGRLILSNQEGDKEISGLFADSRAVLSGGLFFCLEGGRVDGHDYASVAVKNGAVAVVVQRELRLPVPQIVVSSTREALAKSASYFYGEPAKKLKIVAVTGTNGKTTTVHMLSSILRSAGKRVGIIGTLGASFEEDVWEIGLTTPDPILLHELLAFMLSKGAEYVVMEASAHALYFNKLVDIPFTACIFTNLSQDHLDFFQTMYAYKTAKLRLFAKEICPIAIVNGDDETGREIFRLRERGFAKTSLYGLTTPTDAFAVITREGLDGTDCMLNLSDRLCRVRLSLVGRHNVYNALAAATCAVELGLDVGSVACGLKKLVAIKGRLQRVSNYHGADVYVDFAHTPDGLEKSLDALRPHTKGRLVCLFGCGGNRDREKRPLMGEVASKKSDFSILTSDNPRYEDPLDILSEVERGYRRFSSRYVVVPDRARAIEYALGFLSLGDVLLIAGKGGEDTQEIMGIKYPFDDQTVVERLSLALENDGV